MRMHYQTNGGFSILDMITLMAVITILFSLALPLLTSSRDIAWQTSCIENQKKLTGALTAYAADHEDEILPSLGLPAGGFWQFPYIHDKLTSLEARNIVQDLFKESSPLFPYIQKVDVIHCPGDYRASKWKPTAGWAYDSYAKLNPMNGQGWQSPFQTPFTKTSDIKVPALTLSFVESSDPRDYNRGTWVMNVGPSPNWVDTFGIFHGSESSFSYNDGHAEVHTWRDDQLIKAAIDSSNGTLSFFWPRGNIENPDYRWVYQRYRFKGWQPLKRPQE